jgi:Leucine-rich repeat (LRR) protein
VIIVVLISSLQVMCRRVVKREAVSCKSNRLLFIDFLITASLLFLASHCRRISTRALDCSQLSLTSIPNDIPNTILALNLSHNQIALSEESFNVSFSQLQELDLSSNGINELDKDTFRSLTKLERLFLRNNSISDLDPDTFTKNSRLERLDLSMNPLELQITSNGFLTNANLEELNLDECGLTEIPEGAFHGIAQLKQLTLLGNPFDENLDVSAFEDLTQLTRLHIRNISRDATEELCQKLSGIDAVTFEGFNLSCFIFLTEDGNFDDAIVGLDAPIEQPMQLPILPAPTKTTTPPTTSTIQTTTAVVELPTEKSKLLSSSDKIETSDHSNNVTTSPDINHAVVDIDNETIKYILMGEFCCVRDLFKSCFLLHLVCLLSQTSRDVLR